MRRRLLSGWTFRRAVYALVGAVLLVQSVQSGQWPAMFFGFYLFSMGIFNYGCASGTCTYVRKAPNDDEGIQFEEVKQKAT